MEGLGVLEGEGVLEGVGVLEGWGSGGVGDSGRGVGGLLSFVNFICQFEGFLLFCPMQSVLLEIK